MFESRTCPKLMLGALLLLGLSLATAVGQKKGKPPKDDPPPPTTDVQYETDWIPFPVGTSSIQINQMNNAELVVGWYVQDGIRNGFLYDNTSGVFVDLNDLVAPPEGWRIQSAIGTNDLDAVVGRLEEDGSGDRIPFLIHDVMAAAPVLELLPDLGRSQAWRINTFGDILVLYRDSLDVLRAYLYNSGLYDPADAFFQTVPVDFHHIYALNDLGQVAGTDPVTEEAFVYTPGVGATYHPGRFFWVMDLNSAGQFCGQAVVQIGRGKGKAQKVAFRHGGQIESILTDGRAEAINSDGDLAANHHPSGPAYVYHNEEGLSRLEDLIADPADANLWASSTFQAVIDVTDRRPIIDYGALVAEVQVPLPDGSTESRGCVLRPFLP